VSFPAILGGKIVFFIFTKASILTDQVGGGYTYIVIFIKLWRVKMKKLFSPLFVFLFSFISILLISCSNLNGSAESSVSFSLSQELFTAAANRAAIISGSSDEASLTIEITLFTESGTKLSTQSETHTSSEWKELLSSDKKSKQIAFGNLPVGSKIYAAGEIFEDSTSLLKGQTEVITVKTGLNTMRLVFKSSESEKSIPLDGTITIENETIKYTLAKKASASSEKFYLNKGTFAFSLLDEDGNDVLADVNWDAYSENDGFLNQHLLNISYEITYKGHSVNSLSDDGFNYVQISSYNPLTKGGSYLLSLTVSPSVSKTTYVNKSGQTVDFPDFEPVSGTFEVEVEDVAYYSFSVNNNEDGYINFNYWTATDNAARAEVESVTSDVFLHLYGEYQGQLVSVFTNMQDWMNSNFSNKTYTFSIDASEVTSTEYKGLNSYALHDLTMIKSIIMPDCVTDYSTAIFQQCTNLEYVKIGSAVNSLAVDYNSDTASDNLFQGCSNLKQVEFTETDAWYNSTASISNTDTLDWTSLTAIDVSNPEVNATNILNGTWKYLYRKTE